MSFSKATVQLPKYQQVVEVVKNEILVRSIPTGPEIAKRSGPGETVWGLPDHRGSSSYANCARRG